LRILVSLLLFVLPGQRARDDLHIWHEPRPALLERWTAAAPAPTVPAGGL